MNYDIYWNLHKLCWSVRQRGKVILHAAELTVKDATFVVQPAGCARVRETGRKNVHAFVRSRQILTSPCKVPEDARRVRYNPRTGTTFVTAEGKSIASAETVYLGSDGRCFIGR